MMMNFFPRELCEKLEKIGCKSESENFYVPAHVSTHPLYNLELEYVNKEDLEKSIPAFYQNDITGCHEQARENMNLIVQSINQEKLPVNIPNILRYHLIDCKKPEEYIAKLLKGAD